MTRCRRSGRSSAVSTCSRPAAYLARRGPLGREVEREAVQSRRVLGGHERRVEGEGIPDVLVRRQTVLAVLEHPGAGHREGVPLLVGKVGLLELGRRGAPRRRRLQHKLPLAVQALMGGVGLRVSARQEGAAPRLWVLVLAGMEGELRHCSRNEGERELGSVGEARGSYSASAR